MTAPKQPDMSQDKAMNLRSELALAQRLKRVEHENAVLLSQIKILNAELTKSKHVVQQLKDLYSLVDGKIIRLINRRGYRRKNKMLGHVLDVAPYSKKSSMEELLAAAAETAWLWTTAASTALASAARPKERLSIMAADRMVAMGFAMPCPAMSGAEPWMGSYMPRVPSPSEAEGKRPMEPVS